PALESTGGGNLPLRFVPLAPAHPENPSGAGPAPPATPGQASSPDEAAMPGGHARQERAGSLAEDSESVVSSPGGSTEGLLAGAGRAPGGLAGDLAGFAGRGAYLA